MLQKYYHRNKSLRKFILSDNIDEETELNILKLFNLKQMHIPGEVKTRLSDILERFNEERLNKKQEFFSNMHVNTAHDFFFEHPNEHVPALMLTEATRQFLIAVCHKFFNVPLKGHSFVLSGMKLNFLSYLNLNFPITIIGKVNEVKMRKNILSFLDLNVVVSQNNKIAASINFNGKVISLNVFNSLRDDKTKQSHTMRFNPRTVISHNIVLISEEDKKYQCGLIDLSINGFKLIFNDPSIMQEKNKSLNFYLFFQHIGIMNGICEIKWIEEKDGIVTSGFKIKDMPPDTRANFNEILKRYCYVVEEREIL